MLNKNNQTNVIKIYICIRVFQNKMHVISIIYEFYFGKIIPA